MRAYFAIRKNYRGIYRSRCAAAKVPSRDTRTHACASFLPFFLREFRRQTKETRDSKEYDSRWDRVFNIFTRCDARVEIDNHARKFNS